MAREKTKTETKDHVIERKHDFDQRKMIPALGSLKPTTKVTDKVTGNKGYGAGPNADQEAWDELRSKNEAKGR